jgi:hypothetical protein
MTGEQSDHENTEAINKLEFAISEAMDGYEIVHAIEALIRSIIRCLTSPQIIAAKSSPTFRRACRECWKKRTSLLPVMTTAGCVTDEPPLRHLHRRIARAPAVPVPMRLRRFED